MLLIIVMSDLVQDLKKLASRLEEESWRGKTTAYENIMRAAAAAVEEAEKIEKLYEYELKERMNIFATTLRTMTNGEWDKLKEIEPDLHSFIKQAVNR